MKNVFADDIRKFERLSYIFFTAKERSNSRYEHRNLVNQESKDLCRRKSESKDNFFDVPRREMEYDRKQYSIEKKRSMAKEITRY
ncbi:hypothetical protein CEXT_338551 [Caerostris extrusa]|uniref:Ycf1 n=1 Tax=Caerostris extrusa TaxID=172846 RepID=A0AAV4V670_CAEEX|nr:hypothetical protein CEXT_338551 [Caerostris extrusa]